MSGIGMRVDRRVFISGHRNYTSCSGDGTFIMQPGTKMISGIYVHMY